MRRRAVGSRVRGGRTDAGSLDSLQGQQPGQLEGGGSQSEAGGEAWGPLGSGRERGRKEEPTMGQAAGHQDVHRRGTVLSVHPG